MLPAVSEEHALSLLEFQENVKKEEGIHRIDFTQKKKSDKGV